MDTSNQGGFLSALGAYAAQPFSEDMDLTRWFLFLGIVVVILTFWIFVLRNIEELAP